MATKHAIVRQLAGITFAAKSDTNHWVMIDGPVEFGGKDVAPRPKELLLMALGGCTASDVASILKKKRTPMVGFEIHLNANVSDEHPQVFTDIHLEYIFYGDDIAPKDVERAIELSTTKYCAVSAMLKASVNLTHSYEIRPSDRLQPEQLPAMTT